MTCIHMVDFKIDLISQLERSILEDIFKYIMAKNKLFVFSRLTLVNGIMHSVK